MCDKVDILNTVAGRISHLVKDVGEEPCERCKGFTEYKGKCIGYSWDVTYSPGSVDNEGIWNFSLYHHTKEIWYVTKSGTVVDIILAAYEKLASGEWKKSASETWRNKGDGI